MPNQIALRRSILGAWRTNCRVTAYFVEELPASLWGLAIPEVTPRRTIRTVAAHLHNVRALGVSKRSSFSD